MECICVQLCSVFYSGGIKSLKIWGRERRCIYAHTQMRRRSWEWGSLSCSWMEDTPQQGNSRLAKLQKVPFFVWTHILFFSDNICSVPNTQGGEETHTTLPLSFSRCPRVRVRCPRLRSTLTLSGQVQSRAGLAALFTGKEVQGKAGIGAGGEVTGELVSGNRHHAYSVDSGQTSPRDNCHPALARGQCSPNKSLHTS